MSGDNRQMAPSPRAWTLKRALRKAGPALESKAQRRLFAVRVFQSLAARCLPSRSGAFSAADQEWQVH